MKKIILIILILLIYPISAFPQYSKNFEPDYISPFTWQLPFTEGEMATFKVAKVRMITSFVGKNTFTDYQFNEEGQIISDQNYNLSYSSNA